MNAEFFDANGYFSVPQVLSVPECAAIATLAQPGADSVGNRCLLSSAWCVALADRLRRHALLSTLVPAGHVAVQCTYFEKSIARNWLVPIHQDLSIPVAERVDESGLQGWSQKGGEWFVQPPVSVLEQLVAVRLHLDVCTADDGPLKVVPGSHVLGCLSPEAAIRARSAGVEVSCQSDLGGALVMRPMLLHASSKSVGSGKRRVLHFVFGPPQLPHGLRWQTAV